MECQEVHTIEGEVEEGEVIEEAGVHHQVAEGDHQEEEAKVVQEHMAVEAKVDQEHMAVEAKEDLEVEDKEDLAVEVKVDLPEVAEAEVGLKVQEECKECLLVEDGVIRAICKECLDKVDEVKVEEVEEVKADQVEEAEAADLVQEEVLQAD